jgi:hypothetical protein
MSDEVSSELRSQLRKAEDQLHWARAQGDGDVEAAAAGRILDLRELAERSDLAS